MKSAPYVLSVAGFDPSGGAGIAADLKVFDRFNTLGLGALSCLTDQTEYEFRHVRWEPISRTVSTLEMLGSAYPIAAAKIGLAKDFPTIKAYIETIRRVCDPKIPLVVDPISAPSAAPDSKEFTRRDRASACALLARNVILTPNIPEAELYFGPEDSLRSLCISSGGSIILKGGHGKGDYVIDRLYTPDGHCETFTSPRAIGSKHGTGCIFSAALTASLALGCTLHEAITRAQQHLYRYVGSATGGLGLHGGIPE